MEQHDLIQGTPEWHKHRATHYNASDAPAMMGCSPYKSRTQLMYEMVTGITPEVDDATQRRFDDGHRFEDLARPLAEKIIGKRLYRVTGSEGKLSASFDGLTADDEEAEEHKSLNDEIRACFDSDGQQIMELPLVYRVQMEQQSAVSGCKRVLFLATKFDKNDELIEERHCWYLPDLELREQIIAGWEQLEKDREEYKRKLEAGEIVQRKEKPKAEVTIELPALFVHAKGVITENNMDEFGAALTEKLAEVRAIALIDDQDFSNAKEAAKRFRATAKAIALSKEQMLAQTETIGEAARKMDAWAKDLNTTALQLEKDVEREDKAKKEVMVLEGKNAYSEYIASLEEEIKPIRLIIASPNFAEAIKGKRNYASMQDAIDTMLSQAKQAADASAKDIRAKLTWCKESSAGFGFLFSDLSILIGNNGMEAFQAIVTGRIAKHKADEAEKAEAERAKMEAAAKEKAEREAAAKMAEAEAKMRAAQAEEDALVDSIWKNARRIEGDSVQYIKKAISAFESVASDWESDQRPRVATAISEARKDMQSKLEASAEREAMQREHDKAQAEQNAQQVSVAAGRSSEVAQEAPVLSKEPAGAAVMPGGSSATGTKGIVLTDRAAQPAYRPSRHELLLVIGDEFDVSEETALDWIIAEFAGDIQFEGRKAA